MTTKHKLLIALLLILIGVGVRLMPHIWNVAPIAAIALVSAVYLGRYYALIVPVLAMFLGDLFLGFYDAGVMIAVYGSFALVGLIGLTIKKVGVTPVVLASLSASVLFFLVTNFAVWQFTPWYDKSLIGLLDTYVAAIPFFRNTLIGDLIYTGSFFAVFEFARYYVQSKKYVPSGTLS